MRIFYSLINLIKEINISFSLFWYHLHHLLNIYVPYYCAKIIADKNLKIFAKQNFGDIIIPSFDGSNQVVHPDLDLIGDNIVLVCTPYPYAMEEYENPCLYIGSELSNLKPQLCPLDTQCEHLHGVHMSDPCVVVSNNTIYCIYRETIKKVDKIYIKSIQIHDGSILNDKERVLLLESNDNYILSPASFISDREFVMYHVEYNGNESKFILNLFDYISFRHREKFIIEIENEPKRYSLWHIGIVESNSKRKNLHYNDKLTGIFLYKNNDKKEDFKLFYAEGYYKNDAKWKIIKEIEMPDKIKKVMRFPYKSCFNPLNGNILLSFRDNKIRNRLIEMDFEL